MFNKEQLAIINTLLLAKYESLGEMFTRKSRQLGPHPGEAIAAIMLARTQVKEMLNIIESHLGYTTFEGQAYLDIPTNDSETWESIHVGQAEEIRKMATEKFGANDFGYVRLVTLGEATKNTEE